MLKCFLTLTSVLRVRGRQSVLVFRVGRVFGWVGMSVPKSHLEGSQVGTTCPISKHRRKVILEATHGRVCSVSSR